MSIHKVNLNIRPMQCREEAAVSSLVEDAFQEFVAPDYSSEGVENFLKFVMPEAITERIANNTFILVAEVGATLAGMIEVRSFSHISLLFVAQAFQKQGIATELWAAAQARCKQTDHWPEQFTVNSSPYAVPIYERFGFVAAERMKTVDGITFMPMVLNTR